MSTETRGDRGPDGLRCLRRTLTDLALIALAGLDVVVNTTPSTHYSFLLPVLACLALLFRREFPRTALLLTIPGLVVGFTVLAAMVALYSVARARRLDWQLIGCGLLAFGGCLTLGPMQLFPDVAVHEACLRALYAALLAGAPIAVGQLVRARCELTDKLTELAAGRERQQKLHDHAVRAEERTRLAREMHDVVSHQVTLIAIQAGALQVVAEDPDSREIALTIRRLSNRTLEELRNLVGLLRSSTLDCEAAQPGLEDVPELVADSGLPTTLTMGPMPGPVSPQLGCAVYRTVQEALTNIGKHASGAPVTVHLGLAGGSLHVEVRNASPRGQDGMAPLPPGGHGLMGLRERAAMLGGTLTAQPTEDGGYVVHASFPLTAENLAAPAPAGPVPVSSPTAATPVPTDGPAPSSPAPAPVPVTARRISHAAASGQSALASAEHLAMLRHPRPREPSPAELHLSAQ
ncbi:sensor histidine kinase [Crossiella cryophila]|uniref:histidine kinase n=1 Tax=Crossiella cryophila TaxID=43355 RepID=A0A7W7FU45_9PSEU|nr:histidine kinase [Crossiella cryophila]MBB4677690.1 signal transduction histidine kinase [Crossiella cryophila]